MEYDNIKTKRQKTKTSARKNTKEAKKVNQIVRLHRETGIQELNKTER